MRIREHDADALAFFLKALKNHLRITSDDLDGELMAKLTAAVDSAEHYIGKTVLRSTITDTLPFSLQVALSRPLLSVDGFEVDDTETDDYETDIFTGMVLPGESVEGRVIRVTYRAGMVQVPSDILNAILLMASSLFANPMDSVETLPKASAMLLRPYRTYETL